MAAWTKKKKIFDVSHKSSRVWLQFVADGAFCCRLTGPVTKNGFKKSNAGQPEGCPALLFYKRLCGI